MEVISANWAQILPEVLFFAEGIVGGFIVASWCAQCVASLLGKVSFSFATVVEAAEVSYAQYFGHR